MLWNLNRDKEAIITEVKSRVLDEVREEQADHLLEFINDTLFHERERLRKHAALYRNGSQERTLYNGLSRNLGNLSSMQLWELLEKLVQNYLDEVVGNFDSLMYQIGTMILPGGLTILLNTMSPLRILKNFPQIPSIESTMIIGGVTEKLQRLKEKGAVLVYVPQHQSNLDSPILGLSLYKSNLPPVMYGAGLNLFQIPIFPIFMDRLGAYRVDRLKTSRLYKKVLKEYAATTMEFGYDHLFFPGGTRSRSGGIEKRLKKGLLGTALKAFVSCREQNKDLRFYIVPVTVSYHLVLEARTLVRDHLLETGKHRYIITDDESSQPLIIFNFVNRLLSLEGKVYINFCDPLDPFGNAVDEDGHSVDGKGRKIDIDGYITRDGAIVSDSQRNTVYTRELEKKIVSSYFANTIILTTHLVSHALFRSLRKRSASGDLFKFLREESYQHSVPCDEFQSELEGLLERLTAMEKEGRARLEPRIKNKSPLDILMNALRYFGVFHENPVIERKGNRLFTQDPNLLYYYSNRLAGHNLEVSS
jgi:glycerol-3-phosphate O-acyltransferase